MLLEGCVEDMKDMTAAGVMSLDAQVRAYDLLMYLLDNEGVLALSEGDAMSSFVEVYDSAEDAVNAAYDEVFRQ
jgi:hypothetical protein